MHTFKDHVRQGSASVIYRGTEDLLTGAYTKEHTRTRILREIFGGLNWTDPHDWIAVVLAGITVYNSLDLFIHFGGKALGTH